MNLGVRIFNTICFGISLGFSFIIKPIEQISIIPITSEIYFLLSVHLKQSASGLLCGLLLSMFFDVLMNIFPINQVCSSYITIFSFYIGSTVGLSPVADKIMPRWQVEDEVKCIKGPILKRMRGLTYPSCIGICVGLIYAFQTVTARHNVNFALNSYTEYTEWCSPVSGVPAYVWSFLFFFVGLLCTQIKLPLYHQLIDNSTSMTDLNEHSKLDDIANMYSKNQISEIVQ